MLDPETRPSLIAMLSDVSAENAWNEFHRIYQPLIYRTARARGLQHADAEDMVQEVMAIIGRAVHLFDPVRPGSFRGWLFTVTRNCVVNFLTRGKEPIGSGDSDILRILQLHPSEDEPTATAFRLEYRRLRFQAAAEKLKKRFSDDVWTAFWATAVDQHSISDVAARLKKSQAAIRMARCRVIAQFRKEVEDME